MNMRISPAFGTRQRGTTLIVAIVLLLVMTIITLAAVNVGVFERRTSTNDLRQKMVQQVAEAGLNEAVEFLRLRQDTMVPKAQQATDATMWTLCTATETSFPCGAE